jgi:hypothetical protein
LYDIGLTIIGASVSLSEGDIHADRTNGSSRYFIYQNLPQAQQ